MALTTPEAVPQGSGAASQAAGASRAIVAFDFDGTLTVTDSFTAFLRWRSGPLQIAIGLLRLAPAAIGYLIRRDRGRLKAAGVAVFLRGVARSALEAQAQAFCALHADALLRPDALVAWERHRLAGDQRVIVTASPETVVRPFADRLGADALIATRLAFDERDQVRGGFEGRNCRGEEKVSRLRAHFGEDVRIADAYGDTAGDREMLAQAERGHMRVFAARPRRRVSRA